MNTVNFLAGQNISWSIFCVSSETIFQQFTVFIKAELTQVFEMLRGKKCLGGRRVGHIWEANALLHYLWWIDNNNCGTLAGRWAKYVKRIAFIDSFNHSMHCKSWYLVISNRIFSSSPVYLFYLSPLCCAEAVSGLHLYIATLLLLLWGNVLIQGYNVFTSTQMI